MMLRPLISWSVKTFTQALFPDQRLKPLSGFSNDRLWAPAPLHRLIARIQDIARGLCPRARRRFRAAFSFTSPELIRDLLGPVAPPCSYYRPPPGMLDDFQVQAPDGSIDFACM